VSDSDHFDCLRLRHIPLPIHFLAKFNCLTQPEHRDGALGYTEECPFVFVEYHPLSHRLQEIFGSLLYDKPNIFTTSLSIRFIMGCTAARGDMKIKIAGVSSRIVPPFRAYRTPQMDSYSLELLGGNGIRV
jgi:hypothetical protein